MSEVILHHYPASPFSEKVRRILAYKGVPWRSVSVPRMVPKPDLMPLTGGYRRTPVMQIGAEVYCDTALIAQELEARFPQPTLFPGGTRGEARLLASVNDRAFFVSAVGVVFGTLGASLPPDFVEDRVKFSAGLFDMDRMVANQAHLRAEVLGHLRLLEDTLGDGRAFLLGDAPCLADFSAFHVCWFLRLRVGEQLPLAPFRLIQAWMTRIEGFGPLLSTDMSAEDALAVARAGSTQRMIAIDAADPCALAPLSFVSVVPDDMGFDPVVGQLVGLDAERITVARSDPHVGEVLVHFPRRGFRVRPSPLA